LREQGADRWKICFFGSDTPAAIEEVARGDTDIAIINPANPLAMAVQGTGPYKKPIPLRVITVIPTYDQFVFAVTKKTGLNSLSDIRERRYPLKVSLRGQPDHSNHMMVRETLAAVGFTLDDIVSWGGKVSYDEGLPNRGTHRIAAVERGEIDAVFDEAVNTWVHLALDLDMRLLPIEEPTAPPPPAVVPIMLTSSSSPDIPQMAPHPGPRRPLGGSCDKRSPAATMVVSLRVGSPPAMRAPPTSQS